MVTALLAATAIARPAPPTGQALLDSLSQRACIFFMNQSHPSTGFTKDRAANLTSSDSYDVASIASTGFSLASLAISAKRGWTNKTTALNRARLTMRSLITIAPRERGWFYHWLRWDNGARMWQSEVSSIDTSILLGGAIIAERYFKDPQLTTDFNTMVGAIDWTWMLTNGGTRPNELTFSHGWRPENGWISNRWADYAEQKMLVIQSLGASPQIPSGVWTAFVRNPITYAGYTVYGGGPLFIHQMSEGFIDFSNKKDKLGINYWEMAQAMTRASRQYCINNPKGFKDYGPLYWGLTASDGPDGYDAFGAPGWGSDNGTIAPTCVAASIAYEPTIVKNTLDNFAVNYQGAWGRYGFSNAMNAQRNWIDPDVIGIDLGMMLLALENYRDGFPHKMSMSHPINNVGMARAGFRDSGDPRKSGKGS